MFKFDIDSRNGTRDSEKGFAFKYNCIWILDDKFSKSRTGYLSLAVNALLNATKISRITKGDIFQISFSHSDEKIWWKCSHIDFTSVWEPSTCWLSKGVLRRCFLEIGLTKSLAVCNFRNKVALEIIFFSKCLKLDVDSRNGTKDLEKVFGFKDNCISTWDDKFS